MLLDYCGKNRRSAHCQDLEMRKVKAEMKRLEMTAGPLEVLNLMASLVTKNWDNRLNSSGYPRGLQCTCLTNMSFHFLVGKAWGNTVLWRLARYQWSEKEKTVQKTVISNYRVFKECQKENHPLFVWTNGFDCYLHFYYWFPYIIHGSIKKRNLSMQM